jgi:magnesium-transporting ATPase (P-type)
MALATDGILGSLAISVHGAFDAVGAGLLELAAAAARFFAHFSRPLRASRTSCSSTRPLCGPAWWPVPWSSCSFLTKLVCHSAVAVPSKKPHKPLLSAPETKDDLKTLPMAEVEKKLGSSPDGLSQAEAAKRLTQYGPNEIEEKKQNVLLKILSYFWGPIPWMIEVAVVLSGAVRHWPDFFIILILLVSNAAVGFFEERQAGDAIEALKARLAIKARVKRDGKWITPPARELVPGDVIRLRLGDIVPAVARLLDGDEISLWTSRR